MNYVLLMKCVYVFIVHSSVVFDESQSALVSLKVLPNNKRVVATYSLPLPTLDGSKVGNSYRYVTVMSRERYEETIQLTSVVNFRNVLRLDISNFNLATLPKFNNVSVISLEVSSNRLQNITKDSLSQIPMVVRLSYKSNQIEQIEYKSFGINVERLLLNCNQLTDIDRNWFQNPANLRALYLRNNRISFIRENFSQGFHKLQEFDVTNNQIKRIGDGAFIGSSYFPCISLQGNQLNEISSNLFLNGTRVEILNLADNRLTYLPENLFVTLQLERLLMFGNPWQCSCYKKITLWLQREKITSNLVERDKMNWSETNPVCITPLAFQRTCVEDVDDELYNSYIKSDLTPVQFTEDTCYFEWDSFNSN